MKNEVIEKRKEGTTWKVRVHWKPSFIDRFVYGYKNCISTYTGDLESGFSTRNTEGITDTQKAKGYYFCPPIEYFEQICFDEKES
jgi:hypothetical protein